MTNENRVDIEGEILDETDEAILFATEMCDDGAWLPKKAIKISRPGRLEIVSMPERMAVNKGLV